LNIFFINVSVVFFSNNNNVVLDNTFGSCQARSQAYLSPAAARTQWYFESCPTWSKSSPSCTQEEADQVSGGAVLKAWGGAVQAPHGA